MLIHGCWCTAAFSNANEQKMISTLNGLLRRLLSAYPTTLEEDAAALKELAVISISLLPQCGYYLHALLLCLSGGRCEHAQHYHFAVSVILPCFHHLTACLGAGNGKRLYTFWGYAHWMPWRQIPILTRRNCNGEEEAIIQI